MLWVCKAVLTVDYRKCSMMDRQIVVCRVTMVCNGYGLQADDEADEADEADKTERTATPTPRNTFISTLSIRRIKHPGAW